MGMNQLAVTGLSKLELPSKFAIGCVAGVGDGDGVGFALTADDCVVP